MNLSVRNTCSSPSFINAWFLTAGIVALVGIFFSRAMISIGMIGIVLLYFINRGWAKPFINKSQNLLWFFLAPVLIIYIIGVLWTEDYSYWLERIQVKIPLLFLPLGFWAVQDTITRKTIDILITVFIALCVATALGSFIYYLLHYKEITESYKHAKTIPTIIEHIRYSLLLTVAFFAAIHAYFNSVVMTTKLQKNLMIGMAIFLFLFLHILSIRSGLLALYSTCFLWLLIQVFQSGNKKLLWLLPGAVAFLVAMYFFVPSLHNKVNYMVRDVNQFITGKSVNNYSDGNRLLSMKIGVEVGLKHPFVGVGSGDVQKEMNAVYKSEYPEIDPWNWLVPHSQFVYIFTALGFMGFLLFIACLLFPFLNKEVFSDVLCLAVLVSSYTSFLSEATLELQQGIVLISLLFSLSYIRLYSKA
jgi:O-antigen ligase